MAQQGTLNIRLSESLKRHGCEVLDRQGISTSEAVRALFEYLEREQALPEQLFSPPQPAADPRRALLRSMVGVLSPDYSLADARRDRLAAKEV
ncbi:MAG: type II toxin-antitoxin system RelB/DinJ family antitoxin [Eggerthellaceae bacterium]|nr:type II toxin-antitoxin system RelB/DinJ family antitoxin [Eggerthellaceae bacterium]